MELKNELVLSFWQYLDFSQMSQEELSGCVGEWKDLCMNLGYSFWYDPDKCPEQRMLDLLDDCHRNGMQLIIVHSRLHWDYLKRHGAEKYEAEAKDCIARFGSHPACFGFMIGDEPNAGVWETAKLATKIVQRNTDKVAFLNFNPPWFGEQFRALMGFPGEEYPQKLDEFIAETGLKVLCYDFYGSMCTHHRSHQINAHFRDLRMMHAVAAKRNIPCWNSGLSIGHWDFRVPSKDDLRWMLSTSVAHGMKGVLWFVLYQGRKPSAEGAFRENWEGAPYNPFGEKTETWYHLRDIQREFRIKYGDILPYLVLEDVHHYGRPYGGYDYYYDGCDAHIAHFESQYRTDAAISRFRDTRTGEPVYMIVNNSQEEKDCFRIEFPEAYKRFNTARWLNPGGSFMVRLTKEGA